MPEHTKHAHHCTPGLIRQQALIDGLTGAPFPAGMATIELTLASLVVPKFIPTYDYTICVPNPSNPEGDYQFQCDGFPPCKQCFTSRSRLAEHRRRSHGQFIRGRIGPVNQRVPTAERQSQCTGYFPCENCYKHKESLVRHVKRKHSSEKRDKWKWKNVSVERARAFPTRRNMQFVRAWVCA